MKSNIRKLRNERNISQSTLAEVIGKTQQAVSHMEQDRDRIPIESLITMSEYFGVSTDYILGIEPKEDSKQIHQVEDTIPQNKAGLIKNLTGENKKVLYQIILTLLLDSIDDDAASAVTTDESHI